MAKGCELARISGNAGNYTAHIYNKIDGYYFRVNFMWYSKREMFSRLRREYDCSVGREFYKGGKNYE